MLAIALFAILGPATAQELLLQEFPRHEWRSYNDFDTTISIKLTVYENPSTGLQRWDYDVEPAGGSFGDWWLPLPVPVPELADIRNPPGWTAYVAGDGISWVASETGGGGAAHFGFTTRPREYKELEPCKLENHSLLNDWPCGRAGGGWARYPYDNWYENMPYQDCQVNCGMIHCPGVTGRIVVPGLDPRIDAVEVTQAIQEYQKVEDLKALLDAGTDPPVPIVAGKSSAIRVYPSGEAMHALDVKVTANGQPLVQQNALVASYCNAGPNSNNSQRRREYGCKSIDFQFTPPPGAWNLKADLLDHATQQVIYSTGDLKFKSHKSTALKIQAATVCWAKPDSRCGNAALLPGYLSLWKKIAPTANITLTIGNQSATGWRRYVRHYIPINSQSQVDATAKVMSDLIDAFPVNYRILFGAYPATPFIGGQGGYLELDHGPGVPHSFTGYGVVTLPFSITPDHVNPDPAYPDISAFAVAHEAGHSLGLEHTGVNVPFDQRPTTGPGCWDNGANPAGWPYRDNYLQSGDGKAQVLEVGFDTENRIPILPEENLDVMGYCVPSWIAPVHYRALLVALETGIPQAQAMQHPQPAAVSMAGPQPKAGTGTTVRIVGSFDGATATFAPVFASARPVSSGSDSGTHSLEVQDGSGVALFASRLSLSRVSDAGHDLWTFHAALPVSSAAARIVLKDPSGSVLGTLDLTGAPPVVTITSPTSAFSGVGDHTITWTVQDPDSAAFSSQVSYTPDGGATWIPLVGYDDDEGSADISYDSLPGSNGLARIRVEVSDGAHSSSAFSPVFSVPRKGPVVSITNPTTSHLETAIHGVFLEADAQDLEDGDLDGPQVRWTSDLQGFLGEGRQVTVNFRPGTHLLTVQAKDSDGNAATASRTVTVAGDRPTVTMSIKELDPPFTTCAEVTISATKGASFGADLTRVAYQSDAGPGRALIDIPLNQLPFTFTIPGSGIKDVVAMVEDAAGQSDLKEIKLALQDTCQPKVMPLAPAAARLNASQTQQFNATVIGTTNTAITWSAAVAPGAPAGASPGTIGTSGVYTAPATLPRDYNVIVTARSVANPSKAATAAVTLVSAAETVSTPALPAGPTDLVSGTLYGFNASGATSGAGHAIQYSFNWGDGTSSGWTPPGVAMSFHTWPRTGQYTVTAQARCIAHPTAISQFSNPLVIQVGGEDIGSPDRITGPASGVTQATYTYSASGARSNAGHPLQYRFRWGDGTTSVWLPVGTTSASHSWQGPRTATIQVEARCATDTEVVSGAAGLLKVAIAPAETISTPAVAAGPAAGATGTAYTYTSSGAASTLGHAVQYMFVWGDGTNSGWLPAGTGSASHAWSSAGAYSVTVLARCATDVLMLSTASGALTVSIQAP